MPSIDPNNPIHPVHPNQPPDVKLIPPLKGMSTAKEVPGVSGDNTSDGDGVLGESSHSGVGVHGIGDAGAGVLGECNAGRGVAGTSNTGQGVYGHSKIQAGVVGESDQFDGVFGVSHKPTAAGVSGHNPGGLAGFFDGNVTVTGDIYLTNAGDCAEDFDIADADSTEPGTVMVLGEEEVLLPSYEPYDKRVAGVISGAGNYKPGIVLDKKESQQRRLPVALLGKVFCKADAQFGPIAVGDLLTTSSTPGHAMKSDDPMKAFGAVIGKALRPLKQGQGLIPILIALQ